MQLNATARRGTSWLVSRHMQAWCYPAILLHGRTWHTPTLLGDSNLPPSLPAPPPPHPALSDDLASPAERSRGVRERERAGPHLHISLSPLAPLSAAPNEQPCSSPRHPAPVPCPLLSRLPKDMSQPFSPSLLPHQSPLCTGSSLAAHKCAVIPPIFRKSLSGPRFLSGLRPTPPFRCSLGGVCSSALSSFHPSIHSGTPPVPLLSPPLH